MAERTLAYFMRETAKKQEIVEVPALNPSKMKTDRWYHLRLRCLPKRKLTTSMTSIGQEQCCAIKRANQSLTGDRQYLISIQTVTALSGALWWKHWFIHLHNKELMEFFDCYDFSEMPLKVFPNPKEYDQVANIVLSALGILEEENEDSESEVQEAKN